MGWIIKTTNKLPSYAEQFSVMTLCVCGEGAIWEADEGAATLPPLPTHSGVNNQKNKIYCRTREQHQSHWVVTSHLVTGFYLVTLVSHLGSKRPIHDFWSYTREIYDVYTGLGGET